MKCVFLVFYLLAGLGLYADSREVKMAASPVLSPDGSLLVFNWNGDLWKVSRKGGTAIRLTSHLAEDTSPVFSPDGKSIAFVSSREGYYQVYVIGVEGGPAKRIGFHSEGYKVLDWYSDGKALLVSALRDHHGRSGQRLYKLSLDRKAEEELFNAGVTGGVLSPDDNRILFTREGTGLYRKGYKGSQNSQIWLFDKKTESYVSPLKGEYACRSPMWSATGDSFYYVSNESGAFNIWQYTFAGAKKQQLTAYKDDGVIRPSIAKNGQYIVYRQKFDLYTLNTETLKRERIRIGVDRDVDFINKKTRSYKTSKDLDFSSDGLEVVFSSGNDLWVMDTILKEPVALTKTAVVERDVIFSKDNKAVYCIRDNGLKTAIIKIEKEKGKYWWQCRKFKETVLLESVERQESLKLSPDGKSLSFIRGNGQLIIFDLKTKKELLFLDSWNSPSYNWSPNSKWIAYAVEDNNYNNDIWLAPVDASRPPYNVSFHPDYDSSPTFSPDGKMLVFNTYRFGDESEVAYVHLTKLGEEDSARDRTLVKALEAMKKRKKPEPKKVVVKGPAEKVDSSPKNKSKKKPVAKDIVSSKEKPKEIEDKAKETVKKKTQKKEIKIDFDGLSERVRFIKSAGTEYGFFWSADSKQLGFLSKKASKTLTMKVTFPDSLKPSLFFNGEFYTLKWLKSNVVLGSYKNIPASFSKGKVTQYPYSVVRRENRREKNRVIFRTIWRMMRDLYYDETLNNRNWAAIRKKYENMIVEAPDSTVFDRTIAMLLGELNGSHLGYRSRTRKVNYSSGLEVTGHLGVRFDTDFKGPGLKVTDVISGTSASFKKSLLRKGDIILSIDGQKCSINDDMTTLLNGPLRRDIHLSIEGEGSKKRKVTIRPHSYSEIRSLLYDEWLESNRQKTQQSSKGAIGYLHVSRMQWDEFNKFREEVYKEGDNRAGLIIDVRDNGGGFTADHLLTVLCQPKHAICVPRGGPRGYPQSRQVYASWSKPVIVLCNQNSFSNAEIFSHAVKNLGRAKLVGVPTAGGVISTGAADILGSGTLRIPFRGWYVLKTGEDMELNGAVPDVVIWPLPGEIPSGKDRQLGKAVELLLEDIKEAKKKGAVQLIKASER